MSRIWWATILGLLLGAFALAAVQRSCSVSADLDSERLADLDPLSAPDDPTGSGVRRLDPVTIAPTTPNLGVPKADPRDAIMVEPIVRDTPETPAVARGKTREELRAEAQQRRDRAAADVARMREREAERQRRSRELSLQLAQDSGALRGDDVRRVTRPITSTTSPSALDAQRRFREQLIDNAAAAGSDSSGEDRGAGGAGPAGEGGEDGGSSDSDLPGGIPQEALDALRDLGGIPGSDAGGGNPRGGAGGGSSDIRNSGGGSLDLSDVAPRSVWESVGEGETPAGGRVAASDLFLGFVTRPTIPVISSNPMTGLSAPGGGFFSGMATPVQSSQAPSGQLSPVAVPSSRIDSFLTLGGATPFLTPGSETDPSLWGESIEAEWATTDFSAFQPIQDPARFGDNRYYVWVGRFAAPAGVTRVSGTLGVTWLDLATFTLLQLDVMIPNCPDCWLEAPPVEPEIPDGGDGGGDPEIPDGADPGTIISTFTVTPGTIAPGATARAEITLGGPAPATGAAVLVSVSDPDALIAPAVAVVLPGQTMTSFTVEAAATTEAASVTVSVTLEGRRVTRTVSIQPNSGGVTSALDRITIRPQQILGGLTAQGTVRLAAAAPAEGVTVSLGSSSGLAIVPAQLLVPAGALSARFDIQTQAVLSDAVVMITATLGGESRGAELVLKSEVFGDVNRDGVVDGLDLAALLSAMMNYDAAADLDGDGDVDVDDLAALVELLETSGGVGQQPGGDLPVVSRWVPVAIPSAITELRGYRSADLYLGYLSVPGVPIIESAPNLGLRIENGVFYQHPFPVNNGPTTPGAFSVLPAVEFDSYLTIGEAVIQFTPSYPAPDAQNWGTALVAEWFTLERTIEIIQDPDRFGDDRYYVRIARVTVPTGTRFLGGTLETISIRAGVTIDRDVVVYHCSSCWGQFDLTGDGVVSDADLEVMIGLLGQADADADLDGDGVVDLDDLRLLIAAIGT